MTYLPLDQALSEMAIRVFATKAWMEARLAKLSAEKGESEALAVFNREAAAYGIQAA